MENDFLELERRDDGYAVVRFSGPKAVTTLSEAMVGALEEVLQDLEAEVPRGLVLRGTKPSGFMAGADLQEFLDAREGLGAQEARTRTLEAVRRAQEVFGRFEALSCPVVAAIHGAALGGGYELALACDARIAADESRTTVGLPEVTLGLVPAAGGTQRLTRMVGMMAAMDLILSGKRLGARQAQRKGLVDRLVPPASLESQALRLARQLAARTASIRKRARRGFTARVLEAVSWGRDTIESKAMASVEKKTGGHYPAPGQAAKLIAHAADGGSLEEGLRLEREALADLLAGDVARNLIRVFFLMEGGKASRIQGDAEPRKVSRIGVVGAGFMGSGIAQLAAAKDYRVRLRDRDEAALGKGMKACADLFKKLEKLGRLGPGGVRTAMGRILPSFEDADLARSDLVVEAVFEDAELKRGILSGVEAEVGEDTVLATNTSGIPLAELAGALERPENLVGMHFFSPVHKMPLLEVIRGEATSDEAVATTVAVGQRMGKSCVVVKDGPGFFTTRVLGVFLAQVMGLFMDGADVASLDRAFEEFGWPVGPFKLMDEVGIDVGAKVSRGLHEAFPDRVGDPAPILALVEAGRTGRKGGKGFYLYGDKGKGREVDESVYEDVSGRASSPGLAPEVMVDRVMAVLGNECVRCLEEGVIAGPDDGDRAMVLGLGFPPFRGGVFRWIDDMGTPILAERLKQLAAAKGAGYAACDLLAEKAAAEGTFYE